MKKWAIFKKILNEKGTTELWEEIVSSERAIVKTVKILRDHHPHHYWWYQDSESPYPSDYYVQ